MSSYYDKYINYKNKYLNLKENIVIIPKGEILFRTAPSICNYKNIELCYDNLMKCSDSGKTGIYFGRLPIIAISMCIEYNKLMEFGVFKVLEDIIVYKDKYGFREINPERYYKDNKLIPYVSVKEEENINHIHCPVMLIKNMEKGEYLLPDNITREYINNPKSCEIFLTKKDIPKIKLIKMFKFNPEIIKISNDLLTYLQENNYPFNLDKYINDNILIPFECSLVNDEIRPPALTSASIPVISPLISIPVVLPPVSRPVVLPPVSRPVVPPPVYKPVPSTSSKIFVPTGKYSYLADIPMKQKSINSKVPVPASSKIFVPTGNYAYLAGIPMRQPRKIITFTGGDISKYE